MSEKGHGKELRGFEEVIAADTPAKGAEEEVGLGGGQGRNRAQAV